MRTITVEVDGYLARWSGGSFIAVWRSERSDQHVPDEMISIPSSLVKAHIIRGDIIRILEEAKIPESKDRRHDPHESR